MTERINSRLFHEAEGIEDWRVLYGRAFARFRTGSFAQGVALVDAIGSLADAAEPPSRTSTCATRASPCCLVTHEVGGLSARDVALARQISAAARRPRTLLPTRLQSQHVNLTIDALVRADVHAVLARGPRLPRRGRRGPRRPARPGAVDLVPADGRSRAPSAIGIHVDVAVPHEQAEARVAAALAAGGRLVTDEHRAVVVGAGRCRGQRGLRGHVGRPLRGRQ